MDTGYKHRIQRIRRINVPWPVKALHHKAVQQVSATDGWWCGCVQHDVSVEFRAVVGTHVRESVERYRMTVCGENGKLTYNNRTATGCGSSKYIHKLAAALRGDQANRAALLQYGCGCGHWPVGENHLKWRRRACAKASSTVSQPRRKAGSRKLGQVARAVAAPDAFTLVGAVFEACPVTGGENALELVAHGMSRSG